MHVTYWRLLLQWTKKRQMECWGFTKWKTEFMGHVYFRRKITPHILYCSSYIICKLGVFWLAAAIVETGEDWAELAVVTFLNMCTEKELDMEQSVRYLKVQKYKKKSETFSICSAYCRDVVKESSSKEVIYFVKVKVHLSSCYFAGYSP